jgi:hypothetical protein
MKYTGWCQNDFNGQGYRRRQVRQRAEDPKQRGDLVFEWKEAAVRPHGRVPLAVDEVVQRAGGDVLHRQVERLARRRLVDDHAVELRGGACRWDELIMPSLSSDDRQCSDLLYEVHRSHGWKVHRNHRNGAPWHALS